MSIRQLFLSTTLLAALVATQAPAQNPKDLLDRAKADQSVLLSKLDNEMRAALSDARRLQAVSQPRAINALRVALNKLEDPLVPPDFRNRWSAALNEQIRGIENGKRVTDPPEATNPVKREIKEADLRRAKAVQEEYADVRRSLDTVAALLKAGSTAQARTEADALIKRHPNNPAAILLAENSVSAQRVTEARVLVDQQKQGYYLAMKSIDKSNVIPKGDIEFDAERFREITKLRMKPLLTKKEQSILRALDSPINLGYKDAPFEEVIKAISTATGQNILLDKSALQSASIDSNTPTSITLRGGAARTALRKVLQDHGLTYIIKDEAIQVVTLEQARSTLVTRVYYVGDLVNGTGPFGGAINWGPYLDFMQSQENLAKLVEMVKAIDPFSWQGMGGNGTVTPNLPSMSLIVRQTAEFHAKLGSSLGR
jgi:hypothetical protein